MLRKDIYLNSRKIPNMPLHYESDFYKKKYIISAAYLVGILLFLLPFVEIKCNNTSFAQNSGLGLALGTDYKILESGKTSKNENLDSSAIKASRNSGKMYGIALFALVLGLLGLGVSLFRKRFGSLNIIVGSLAALMLIVLMVQLKYDVDDRMKTHERDSLFSNEIRVTINFTTWYYLSIVCFLMAAFLSFKQSGVKHFHDEPPKKAPQVSLNNPGDQSEFLTYPDESMGK
ncbi:MAG: hypothetical protein NVS1B13_10940 [Flavisolibacter sp.]